MYRGAYSIIGGKGGKTEQDLYKSYIAKCEVPTSRFVDTCVGAGNITSLVTGQFEEYAINDLDMVNVSLFYGLVKHNKETVEQAIELEKSFEVNHGYCDLDIINSHRTFRFRNEEGRIKAAASALVYKNYLFNGTGHNISASKLKSRDKVWNRRYMLGMYDNLSNCQISNIDLIKYLDRELEDTEKMKRSFYFIDPPYLEAQVNYVDSVRCTAEDFHRQLCQRVRQLKNVMICGFESDLYTEELEAHGFYKTLICEKYVSASSQKGERRKVKEFIWTSYPV